MKINITKGELDILEETYYLCLNIKQTIGSVIANSDPVEESDIEILEQSSDYIMFFENKFLNNKP